MGLLEQRAAYSILLSGRGATARSSSSCSSINSHRVPRNTLGFVFCLAGHIIPWLNTLTLPPPSRGIPSLSSILPVSLWGLCSCWCRWFQPHTAWCSSAITNNESDWKTINSMMDFDQINCNPSVHKLLHTSELANAYKAQRLIPKCKEHYKCRQILAELLIVEVAEIGCKNDLLKLPPCGCTCTQVPICFGPSDHHS